MALTDHWQVAHAFDTSLPKWLVASPRRHLFSLSELEPAAAAELRPLLVDLTSGLEQVTGCVKTYALLLAEAEGFAHLHVHVVPRMPEAPVAEIGVKVFGRLGVAESVRVRVEERDRVSLAVRAAAGR